MGEHLNIAIAWDASIIAILQSQRTSNGMLPSQTYAGTFHFLLTSLDRRCCPCSKSTSMDGNGRLQDAWLLESCQPNRQYWNFMATRMTNMDGKRGLQKLSKSWTRLGIVCIIAGSEKNTWAASMETARQAAWKQRSSRQAQLERKSLLFQDRLTSDRY